MTQVSAVAPASVPAAQLHVIVTCTDRKTHQAPASLSASSLPDASLVERLAAWTHALETVSVAQIAADKLYSGDQWHVARGLGTSAPSGVRVCIWVASAGYGLIRPESLLKPYAATFATGHRDTVVPHGAHYRTADWWNGLASWQQGGDGAPRTVAAIARLAKTAKNGFVLVAASESYAMSMIDDLDTAAQMLPDRFALISVGLRIGRSGPSEQRPTFLMPGEAKLRSMVGGATHSLNARLARRAVTEAEQWLPSAERLRVLMQSWIDASPPTLRYDRDRMSDKAIRAYIAEQLDHNPNATHTGLLRTLRNAGQACEQARFAALFRETASNTGGGTVQSPPVAEPVA